MRERLLGPVRYRILDEHGVPVIDDLARDGFRFHDAEPSPVQLSAGVYQLEAYAVGYEPNLASLRVTGETSLELGMHARER